jgi:hypothetical protein
VHLHERMPAPHSFGVAPLPATAFRDPSLDRCLTSVTAGRLSIVRKRLKTDSLGVNVVAADDWHDELVLVAELSSVNNQIARFVLRMLDTDAHRREQMAVADECRLGGRLVNLGYALQDRAVHRAAGRHRDGGPIPEAPCVHGRTR